MVMHCDTERVGPHSKNVDILEDDGHRLERHHLNRVHLTAVPLIVMIDHIVTRNVGKSVESTWTAMDQHVILYPIDRTMTSKKMGINSTETKEEDL